MATIDRSRKVVTGFKSTEWVTTNLEELEAALGPDACHYENEVLTIRGTVIPTGYNVIWTPGTAYAAGPPEVPYVPGTFVEVVSDADLAAKYQAP